MKWAYLGLAFLLVCSSAGANELTLDQARGREISSIKFLGIVTKAPAGFPMKVGDKVTPDNTNAAVIMTQKTASNAHDYVVSTTYASCYFFEDPAKPKAVKVSFFSFQGGVTMKSSGGGLTPAFGIGYLGIRIRGFAISSPNGDYPIRGRVAKEHRQFCSELPKHE